MPTWSEFKPLSDLTPEKREALYISLAIVSFIGIISYIYINEVKK